MVHCSFLLLITNIYNDGDDNHSIWIIAPYLALNLVLTGLVFVFAECSWNWKANFRTRSFDVDCFDLNISTKIVASFHTKTTKSRSEIRYEQCCMLITLIIDVIRCVTSLGYENGKVTQRDKVRIMLYVDYANVVSSLWLMTSKKKTRSFSWQSFYLEYWQLVMTCTYIDRVRLNKAARKILQVIIPSTFYPFYLRYPRQPWLNVK